MLYYDAAQMLYFHNLTMLCFNLSDIAIITVKGVGYRCIIYGISKSQKMHLLKTAALDDCGYL